MSEKQKEPTAEEIKKHIDKASVEIFEILKRTITELNLNNTQTGWLVGCRIVNTLAAHLYKPMLSFAVEAEFKLQDELKKKDTP
jgi:chaperonin GroEL (HSP60 family)